MIETVPATGGVSLSGLRGGSGSFRHLSLSLDVGLTALYGLNGAGKTTALRIARSAAAGILGAEDWAHLVAELEPGGPLHRRVLRLVGTSVHHDQFLSDQLPGGHWQGKVDRLGPDELTEVLELGIERWFRTGADVGSEVRSSLGEANFPVDLPEGLRQELLRTKSYVFASAGVREPRWDVWLAVPADRDRYPLAWSEIDRALARIEECRQDPDPSAPSFYGWEDVASPAWAWIWRSSKPAQAIDTGVFSAHWQFARDGLPFPMVFLGSLGPEHPFVIADVDEDPTAAHTATASALTRRLRLISELRRHLGDQDFGEEVIERLADTIGTLSVGGVAFAAPIEKVMASWSTKATSLYQGFLQDAHPLELRSGDLQCWLDGDGLSWIAGGMALEKLSKAQQRWARWAIVLGVSEAVDLVLIDEPESALHRSAEDHLARALNNPDLSQQPWVVATHSPMIMDMAGTRCIEIAHGLAVEQGEPSLVSTARPLGTVGLQSLANLGMQPSDLLRRDRVFVLVEGQHDEIVLRTLIGDVIDDSRARILPLRGGSRLKSAVEGSFLAQYTNAYLLAVLDNLDANVVDQAWEEAQRTALTDVAKATQQLLEQLPRRIKSENKFMVEFLTATLQGGFATRAVPYGLKAQDIIEYLPVNSLVPRAKSDWSSLRHEYEGATSASRNPPDFKKWLTATYNVSFRDEDILRATRDLTRVPDEIERLATKISELGDRPPLI